MGAFENFNYEFAIEVLANGKQRPFMKFGINPNFQHLGNLSRGHLSSSSGVTRDLIEIKKVNNGEIDEHAFGGDDWCIVIYKKGTSTIVNGFDEFEPFEIESTMIHKFLIDWLDFLSKYEGGEIPGLIPPNKLNSIES